MTLFLFLKFCEQSKLQKNVLDCGAAGELPPLYIFRMCGYETHGIDVSEEQIKKARIFCEHKGIDLNIERGDMRDLVFEDFSFSFAYSHDTIFHMPKQEITAAMKEMKRVLKNEGILYVNFLSIDDSEFGSGRQVGDGEFIQYEHDGKTLHSYFEDDEPDQYFDGFEILVKQKRASEVSPFATAMGDKKVAVFLDYIAQKKYSREN
jgi:ubiquinone/menaquinone biosynthesis C-methylase UbiE